MKTIDDIVDILFDECRARALYCKYGTFNKDICFITGSVMFFTAVNMIAEGEYYG